MKICNLLIPKIIYYILFFLIISIGFYLYKPIFDYLFFSVFFAYLLNPMVRLLEKKGIGKTFSIVIIYFILALILLLVSFFILPLLINQVEEFTEVTTSYLKNFDESSITANKYFQIFLKKFRIVEDRLSFIDFNSFKDTIIGKIGTLVGSLPSKLIQLFKDLLTILSFVATVPIVSFFLLKDKSFFVKNIYSIVPNRYFEMFIILMRKFDETIGTYLRALMIEIIIVGFMASIVLEIIGVPYSLLIGILAGFANVIPYIGPFIALILAISSILLMNQPLIMIFYVLVGMQFVQIIDNNIVYPIVIGKNTEMHPLIILLTVIAGGYSLGLLGMFLSVPVVFLCKIMISSLRKNLKAFEII